VPITKERDWIDEYVKFLREAVLPEEKMNPEGFIESLQIPSLQAEARKALLGEGEVTPSPTGEGFYGATSLSELKSALQQSTKLTQAQKDQIIQDAINAGLK